MTGNKGMSDGDSGSVVVRFAPSPNGYLHIGHAYSALLNFQFARSHNDRFLLRLEDIDLTRARPHFVQAIYDDLSWLNISWEEPVLRQSEYLAHYRQVLDQLDQMGLLYPCFCSRQTIRSAAEEVKRQIRCDPDGAPVYPGTCRELSGPERLRLQALGKPFALRLNMERALALCEEPLSWDEYGEAEQGRQVVADASIWGDVVLGRKDIGTSYHIAVVADDQRQGITDIIRGEDLFAATSIHCLLQRLLNFTVPRYRHHRLIRDAADNKYSKSANAYSLRQMQEDGVSPEDVVRQLFPHHSVRQ